MKRWTCFAMACILAGVWACASPPPEKPDSDRIKQDSDKGFGGLEREEKARENDR